MPLTLGDQVRRGLASFIEARDAADLRGRIQAACEDVVHDSKLHAGVCDRQGAWTPDPELRYTTGDGGSDPVAGFLAPSMEHACCYLRHVGYFTLSFFKLTSRPVAECAIAGGVIALVCSLDLEPRAARAIIDGGPGEAEDPLAQALAPIIRRIEKDPGARLRFLATLLSHRRLDVRIAIPWRHEGGRKVARRGIFHDKIGVIADRQGTAVSFVGSANETGPAWDPTDGNYESFDAFSSVRACEAPRVLAHADAIRRTWRGQTGGVLTVGLPRLLEEKLIRIGEKRIDALRDIVSALDEPASPTLEEDDEVGINR